MDRLDRKNGTQIAIQEILLNYGRDYYTLLELEQLSIIIYNLYINLHRRLGTLVIHHKDSLASREKSIHYLFTSSSSIERYLIIPEVIESPKTPLESELSKLLQNGLENGHININDYAFGQGDAINQLIKSLFNDPQVVLNLNFRLYDIKDPQVLLEKNSDLKKRKNIKVIQRDLLALPNEENQCHLGIIGFAYFYLHMEDFIKAILYRLKESQFLAIMPSNSDTPDDVSMFLIGRINNEYVSSMSSQDEKYLRKKYSIFD